MLEKTNKQTKQKANNKKQKQSKQNLLNPKAEELKLLHCMVVCLSSFSTITEKVLGALNSNS